MFRPELSEFFTSLLFYDIPSGAQDSGHARKELQQLIMAVSASPRRRRRVFEMVQTCAAFLDELANHRQVLQPFVGATLEEARLNQRPFTSAPESFGGGFLAAAFVSENRRNLRDRAISEPGGSAGPKEK